MKAFFRFILLTLVLLVVALVSALTAMRFAIHGREVSVPDLVGKTPAEARRIADAAGFQMEVERQYYSASIPEGRILSQLPAPGTQVRRGWQIRVADSLGPQRVEIPNVLGESPRAAQINILRRGLDVGSVARIEMSGPPPDQVLGQSPAPNASGIAAPKISLLTTEAALPQAFLMPNFTGQASGRRNSGFAGFGLPIRDRQHCAISCIASRSNRRISSRNTAHRTVTSARAHAFQRYRLAESGARSEDRRGFGGQLRSALRSSHGFSQINADHKTSSYSSKSVKSPG